jgi:hypothetical protein
MLVVPAGLSGCKCDLRQYSPRCYASPVTIRRLAMKFYAVKVEQKDGSLRHPFTLFAPNDERALQRIEANLRDETVRSISFGAIDQMHLTFFKRALDDEQGLVEHTGITWSNPGPIQTIKLFGAKGDKGEGA